MRAQFALVKQLEEERNQCTLQQVRSCANYRISWPIAQLLERLKAIDEAIGCAALMCGAVGGGISWGTQAERKQCTLQQVRWCLGQ